MNTTHTEYCLEAGNDTVIVFIHGILGSPDQFRFMANTFVQRGFDCAALLLPGHGGTARHFHQTPSSSWTAHVKARLNKLAVKYQKIHLVGHSLGGLLCLGYAVNHTVESITLINSPLSFRLDTRQLAFSLKVLVCSPEHDDEMVSAYRRANSVKPGNVVETVLWLKQFNGLAAIARQTQHLLPNVKARVLIVQSAKDESVGRRNSEKLLSGLTHAQTERLDLPNSYHAYFSQADRQTLLESLIAFIAR